MLSQPPFHKRTPGVRKLILLRDDDVSFFTPVAQLETVYEPLLRHNIPINLSVIPLISGALGLGGGTQNPFSRLGLAHEPFIPPCFRGHDAWFQVAENAALVKFITSQHIEVLQHGLRHTWSNCAEFARGDSETESMKRELRFGRELLAKAFSRQPGFFCPPWDQVSHAALRCIKDAGFLGVSMSHLGRDLHLGLWPQLLLCRLRRQRHILRWSKMLLVGHPGYVLSMFHPVETLGQRVMQALGQSDVVVLVNHYWEYFLEGAMQATKDRLAAWHHTAAELLANDSLEFVTFSDLYRRMYGLTLPTPGVSASC